jgi:hypothetical protein
LKIPKGEEESVNQRRTDNTMAKKEKDKQILLIMALNPTILILTLKIKLETKME